MIGIHICPVHGFEDDFFGGGFGGRRVTSNTVLTLGNTVIYADPHSCSGLSVVQPGKVPVELKPGDVINPSSAKKDSRMDFPTKKELQDLVNDPDMDEAIDALPVNKKVKGCMFSPLKCFLRKCVS